MIADQFEPLTPEQAEFWARFPKWDQDVNYAVSLGFIVEESKGRSLEVNLDLARNNVKLAGQIATSWSKVN
jgi:hypothetical protein